MKLKRQVLLTALFGVARCLKGLLILTTNQLCESWPKVFNNHATLTPAVLDRLLHHAETVVIERKSYRTKDQKYGAVWRHAARLTGLRRSQGSACSILSSAPTANSKCRLR